MRSRIRRDTIIVAHVQDEIASLNPSNVTETSYERRNIRLKLGFLVAAVHQHGDETALLRTRRKRPCGRSPADQRNELTPPHGIAPVIPPQWHDTNSVARNETRPEANCPRPGVPKLRSALASHLPIRLHHGLPFGAGALQPIGGELLADLLEARFQRRARLQHLHALLGDLLVIPLGLAVPDLPAAILGD